MSFDLKGALRKLKPQRRAQSLERRADARLRWAVDEPLFGGVLLLDTNVYLDVLQGRTPEAVDALLASRVCNHSSVCLAELTHAFGRLDPAHPMTKTVLQTIGDVIADIPGHRLHAPDTAAWGQAGIVAGALMRLSGSPGKAGHERKFLNDALIYLQAKALGAAVLTGNIRDFDLLSQLVPEGRVIVFRRSGQAR